MFNIDEEIKHVELGDKEVKKWRIGSNKILLYNKYPDFKTLKQDFISYQSMPVDYQLESDWKSIELFNFNNRDRYSKMAHEFLKNDINDTLYDRRYTPELEAALMTPIDEASKYIKDSSEDDIVDRIDADNSVKFMGMPYFTAAEMKYLGVTYLSENPFYSSTPRKTEINNKDWFAQYSNHLDGFGTDNSIEYSKWSIELKKLFIQLSHATENKDINSIKQSILDLGWNPEIPFNSSNQVFANKRISKIMQESVSNYTILDVTRDVEKANDVVNESSLTVYPVYVIFFNSNTFFNKLIRVATDSVYSHAAISFDASLKEMYSFSFPGGFQKQSLTEREDDKAIQVYAVFVTKEKYNKLQNRVKELTIKHSDYSLINLITIPLKINYVDNVKMVCSQFVDSMLKLADLDITKIGSNMVSPGKLNKAAKNKKYKAYIYKVYYGSPNNYSASRVIGYVSNLSKSEMKSENVLVQAIATLQEAKEWPVQFDDDGNLLIDKGLDVDFEAEYSTTHLALKNYEKAKNVEGMKYCLCKLWYLNTILEEKIHQEHDKKKIAEYHKARAKIINDITKYMAIVQKYDKDFDMLKEYQDSPFSDDRVKIRRSTILYTIDLFKRLIGIR